MAASEEMVDFGSLLEARENAIVTLVAGEMRLPVHRAVLESRSPVFKALLQHGTPEVTVPDIEGPVLGLMVAYLYSLRAPEVPDMANQLLLAADKFGLPGLKAECELQVAEQLTAENALDTVVFAKEHSCPALTEAAISFIKGNTHRVMATQAWADAVFHRPAVVAELSQLMAQPSVEIRNLRREEKGRRLIQKAKEGLAWELWKLLKAGAEVGAMDGDMMTALHWAAERGHEEAAMYLVEHGADVNARNGRQSTPLHLAAQNGHAAVVQELLAASADHSARGPVGQTPLHLAAESGRIDVVSALLDGGANKSTKDYNGQTALDYATKSHQKLIQMLK